MVTTVLLMIILSPAVVLRDPIPSSWDAGEAPFGILEALMLIGIVVLLLLLTGVAIWRVRRTSRRRPE